MPAPQRPPPLRPRPPDDTNVLTILMVLAGQLGMMHQDLISRIRTVQHQVTVVQQEVATMTEAVSANQAALDALTESVAGVGVALSKGLDEVKAKIADLEAQIAAGATPESLDFGPVKDAVAAISVTAADLDAVTPDVPPVEPTP